MAINVRAWVAIPPLKPKSGSAFDIAAYVLNWLTQHHMRFDEIAEQALNSDVLHKEALRAIREGFYAEK